MFPEVERVIYSKPPLRVVVCQLRFEPILKITASMPSDFQDAIRREYPKFSNAVQVPSIPTEMLQQIPEAMRSELFSRAYEFSTQDANWTISLTQSFMALTTAHYTKWEVLKEHLKMPLKALETIYDPGFFVRIGLRYQNVIKRTELNLATYEWNELLQPAVAGEFADANVAPNIEKKGTVLAVNLSDRMKVNIQHGIVEGETDKYKRKNLSCYLIDNDFFIEQKVDQTDVWNSLDALNQQSRRVFRWSITDKLHNAMVPEPI